MARPEASRSWRVQLGAFRRPGAPQELWERLQPVLAGKQAFYPAQGSLTALQVGPFPTRASAQAMCRALGRVSEIVQGWLSSHPRGFPPTVLHLTDGESSDGDPTQVGDAIMSLGTDDGRVLLFNCHVSSSRARKVEYPADDSVLKDGFARTLFRISSVLPENFLGAAQQLGVPAAEGSRGFVFNADPSSVVQFYEIGTSLTGMPPHIWMGE